MRLKDAILLGVSLSSSRDEVLATLGAPWLEPAERAWGTLHQNAYSRRSQGIGRSFRRMVRRQASS